MAALIVLSKEINANTFLYFLTPIINCPDNLLPKYINISPKNHVIDEIVKSEMYYFYDLNKKVVIFTNNI
ncbi:hypothetical protein AN269_00145 [Staphylococcus aureus]|nr:hypothetical protein [Staphylococcus aureus]